MSKRLLRRGMVGLGLLLMAALPLARSDEETAKNLKSQDARNALLDYERSIARARKLYDLDAEAARKQLLARLEAAQEKAMKASHLEDAVLIRDLRKGYEDGKLAPPTEGRLQIAAAFYGQNTSWIDVTDKVRQATKGKARWSAVVMTKDWGEPAPGWDGTRTLTVRYSVAGKVDFKASYEGKEISLP